MKIDKAPMQIMPLGDSAVIIRLRETFEDGSQRALDEVLAVLERIQGAKIPGVIELAPAYTSVAVFFDPSAVIAAGGEPDRIFEWLEKRITKAVGNKRNRRARGAMFRNVEIPVCFDDEFALDLKEVAQHARLSVRDVVDLYCGAQYRVSCIGFTPGFPYLGGLPVELATSRRATPRKEISSGAVAIAGKQTGIYPVKSPGGWNIIGRTPVRLFDPKQNPSTLLRAGDRVRFREISRQEFESSKR